MIWWAAASRSNLSFTAAGPHNSKRLLPSLCCYTASKPFHVSVASAFIRSRSTVCRSLFQTSLSSLDSISALLDPHLVYLCLLSIRQKAALSCARSTLWNKDRQSSCPHLCQLLFLVRDQRIQPAWHTRISIITSYPLPSLLHHLDHPSLTTDTNSIVATLTSFSLQTTPVRQYTTSAFLTTHSGLANKQPQLCHQSRKLSGKARFLSPIHTTAYSPIRQKLSSSVSIRQPSTLRIISRSYIHHKQTHSSRQPSRTLFCKAKSTDRFFITDHAPLPVSLLSTTLLCQTYFHRRRSGARINRYLSQVNLVILHFVPPNSRHAQSTVSQRCCRISF